MLWKEMSEECVLVGKSVTEDGEGGYSTRFVDAAHFYAALVPLNTEQEKSGASAPHTSLGVTTENELGYGDLFRRVRDGKTFRVVTVPEYSPATFKFSQVTAEEWEVPNE